MINGPNCFSKYTTLHLSVLVRKLQTHFHLIQECYPIVK